MQTSAAAALSRRSLAALRAGAPVPERALVVVAHPDDETVGLGARLALFQDLHLVHVTDGAPPDGRDAARLGFPDAAGYARARAGELTAALAALGVRARCTGLQLQDQAAACALAPLTHRLAPLMEGAELVLTHAYEGGHPDHDACAFAVQCACALIGQRGARPPLRLEFAGYHKARGDRVVGRFWPHRERLAVRAAIDPAQLARKRAAMDAHCSQAEVLAWFDPSLEMYRHAPTYDFTQPPPPGACLYDDWGLTLASPAWRGLAADALAALAPERAA